MPSNHKNETRPNNKAPCDNVSSNDNITTNGHEVNSLEHAVDENENQNNLNKDLDCCTLEDSSHYNVMEPEKSSDKPTAACEYENNVSVKSYPENNTSPENVCLEDDAQNPAIENGKQQKSQSKAANSHRFNINAPDFVPKNINLASSPEVVSEPIFARYTLRELARYYDNSPDISYEELLKFSETVFERIDELSQGTFFRDRDLHELRTLNVLNAGGQSQINRITILDRVFSIVQKCEYESSRRDFRSPNRYHGNRTGYSGDNYRSRNFSRTSYRH